MNDDDKTNPIQLLEPADYGEYLLKSRSEVLNVLRQLQQHDSLITLFFNEGKDLILTTLLSISDERLIFDCGANTETNQRALNAERLFCSTLLDKVRVQFILRQPSAITHEGRSAFQAALPDNVLRLQRREYYRLALPLTRRLTCQIPVPDGQRIDFDIVDLSGGGMAIVAAPDEMIFSPDMEFAGCHIHLPEVGNITARIRILTTIQITLNNGVHIMRTGCHFVGLPGTMTNLIQRYIIKIERERKASESGLL